MDTVVLAHVATLGYATVAVFAYAVALRRAHIEHLQIEAQVACLLEADQVMEAELARILASGMN